jgi:hypothetical protein
MDGNLFAFHDDITEERQRRKLLKSKDEENDQTNTHKIRVNFQWTKHIRRETLYKTEEIL